MAVRPGPIPSYRSIHPPGLFLPCHTGHTPQSHRHVPTTGCGAKTGGCRGNSDWGVWRTLSEFLRVPFERPPCRLLVVLFSSPCHTAIPPFSLDSLLSATNWFSPSPTLNGMVWDLLPPFSSKSRTVPGKFNQLTHLGSHSGPSAAFFALLCYACAASHLPFLDLAQLA